MTFRDKGKKCLCTVLKIKKNIDTIERNIYNLCVRQKDFSKYNQYILQVVNKIIKRKPLKQVLIDIKEGALGWKHPIFNEIESRIQEQNDYLVHPFEVEEGVLECKCGSKRVYSYQRQSRSSDEPMTTFAQCVACNSRWTYSG